MEIKHKNLLGYNLPVRPPLYKNLLSIKFETGSYFQRSLYKTSCTIGQYRYKVDIRDPL